MKRGPFISEARTIFGEQLTTAIVTASLNALDRLARTVWQGHAVGVIDASGAQDLAEQIHRRRTDARSEVAGRAAAWSPIHLFAETDTAVA